jgi:hypothetical protein
LSPATPILPAGIDRIEQQFLRCIAFRIVSKAMAPDPHKLVFCDLSTPDPVRFNVYDE